MKQFYKNRENGHMAFCPKPFQYILVCHIEIFPCMPVWHASNLVHPLSWQVRPKFRMWTASFWTFKVVRSIHIWPGQQKSKVKTNLSLHTPCQAHLSHTWY